MGKFMFDLKLPLFCAIGDLFSLRYICRSQRFTDFRLFNSKLMKTESITVPAGLNEKIIDVVMEALAFFDQRSFRRCYYVFYTNSSKLMLEGLKPNT